MNAVERILGPLGALHVASPDPSAVVVLLHGYAMRPQDLEPFAHSLGVRAAFYFPRGPKEAPNGARAWWPIDEERRSSQMAKGPRDLAQEFPPHRPDARTALDDFLTEVRAEHPRLPLVLGGFSQGGMLACDTVLCARREVAALVMLSSSRIAFDDWIASRSVLVDLPVFVSHGQGDADLAFSAGENLRDFFTASGARVTWQPFESGHEIPLVVWRSLRRFLSELARENT